MTHTSAGSIEGISGTSRNNTSIQRGRKHADAFTVRLRDVAADNLDHGIGGVYRADAFFKQSPDGIILDACEHATSEIICVRLRTMTAQIGWAQDRSRCQPHFLMCFTEFGMSQCSHLGPNKDQHMPTM